MAKFQKKFNESIEDKIESTLSKIYSLHHEAKKATRFAQAREIYYEMADLFDSLEAVEVRIRSEYPEMKDLFNDLHDILQEKRAKAPVMLMKQIQNEIEDCKGHHVVCGSKNCIGHFILCSDDLTCSEIKECVQG